MKQNLKYFVMGAALVAGGLLAIAAGDLTVFKAGEPIKSADVNSNFSMLKAALEAPIGEARLEDGAVTLPKILVGGTKADGKVLKLQNGSLAWADDLLGTSGGIAYSAGSGLALNGSTFSLANGGITKDKISATGEADGKVLKIQNGALAWANDFVGSSGSSYSADGSSLALTGTTFSVRDRGIGTAKLADDAITAAKLADGSVLSSHLRMPIEIVDGTSSALFSLKNVAGNGLNAESVGGFGVYAKADSSVGVYATSVSAIGVEGRSNNSIGVRGIGANGGVIGESSVSTGVYGTSITGSAISGVSQTGIALVGKNNSNLETLQLIQNGNGAVIDARGAGGVTVFSVDNKGNVYSRSNVYTSDRNAKTNFKAVDAGEVLEKIAALPMSRWNYKQDTTNIQHIGPMAQDFHAAFGLNGSDNKHINSVDMQGVALAAIQGLNQKLESENQALKARLDKLEAQLAEFKATHK